MRATELCGKAFRPAQKYPLPSQARRDELRQRLERSETPAKNSRSVLPSKERRVLKKPPRKIFSSAILRLIPESLERSKFQAPIKRFTTPLNAKSSSETFAPRETMQMRIFACLMFLIGVSLIRGLQPTFACLNFIRILNFAKENKMKRALRLVLNENPQNSGSQPMRAIRRRLA